MSALARLVARSSAAAVDERCELCALALPGRHRHLLDLDREEPRCVCRACALLFDREAAGRGHFRLIPERRTRLDGDSVVTGVPVGLAFFVRQPDGTVLARYPSPVGMTAWEVDDATWSAVASRWPRVGDLTPLVEGLLMNTARGRHEYWILPIDDCYRLVAIVKQHWTGFSGGREVWPAVDRFFAEL